MRNEQNDELYENNENETSYRDVNTGSIKYYFYYNNVINIIL